MKEIFEIGRKRNQYALERIYARKNKQKYLRLLLPLLMQNYQENQSNKNVVLRYGGITHIHCEIGSKRNQCAFERIYVKI